MTIQENLTIQTQAESTDTHQQMARVPRHSPEEDRQIRAFAIAAARLLSDLHCEDVIVLDVRGLSDMSDYILLATGTSDRQIRAVGGNVEDLAAESGMHRVGREVDGTVTWLVVDFVDVVVHLFEAAARGHYDLEMMWGDAPRVHWRRE